MRGGLPERGARLLRGVEPDEEQAAALSRVGERDAAGGTEIFLDRLGRWARDKPPRNELYAARA